MVQIETKIQNKKNSLPHSPLNYNEIVHYLDSNWSVTTSLLAISQLDEHFEFISKKMDTAIISGTSGKSTTIHFTCKLFQEEGLKVGAFYTPHTQSYNERFCINNEQISNKSFTDLANKVIQVAQNKNINTSTKDILTMMALIFFKENDVNLCLLENSGTFALDPVLYCQAKIAAITRVVPLTAQYDTAAVFSNIMNIITPETYFVSADQIKQNIQIMHQLVESKGGIWSMPIRKLTPLVYPFEQLHGRCAALAERIAHLYIDNFLHKNKSGVITESLLNKPKGLRGRPTLEAKKISELNPKKTLEEFWTKTATTLPYRFQVIKNDAPLVLLDNADSIDSLTNLFLGVRLLAYKQQFKNISLIIGSHEGQFEDEDFIKQIRYFSKKTAGIIALCPIKETIGEKAKASWNEQHMVNATKAAKIKTKSYKSFDESFTQLKKTHNDHNSLIVITGSHAIISEYLNYQEVV